MASDTRREALDITGSMASWLILRDKVLREEIDRGHRGGGGRGWPSVPPRIVTSSRDVFVSVLRRASRRDGPLLSDVRSPAGRPHAHVGSATGTPLGIFLVTTIR